MKNHKDWEITRILTKVRSQLAKKWTNQAVYVVAAAQCGGDTNRAEKLLREIDLDPLKFQAFVQQFRMTRRTPVKRQLQLFVGLFIGAIFGSFVGVFTGVAI